MTDAMPTPGLSDPRRTEILKAATELFLDRGYAATSIDAVIEQVGGSKRTLYAMFGSKERLFEEVIRANTAQMFDTPFFGEDTGSLHDTLEGFAIRLLTLFTETRTIGIYRVVVSESARFPNLAESFREQGPLRGRRWLARVLEGAAARGEIELADPDLATGMFLGLVRSDIYFEIVLGTRPAPAAIEIALLAQTATHIFLYGTRPHD